MKIIIHIISILYLIGLVIASPCAGDNWVVYKDEKCFKLIKQYVNYNEASKICNQQRLETDLEAPTLALIKSIDEQYYLRDFIYEKSGVNSNVWIGGKRVGTKFSWSDGTAFNFTNWKDIPSEEVNRDCVEMQSNITTFTTFDKNGIWKAVSCESGNYFVCQKFQTWSLLKFQNEFLETRRELKDTKDELKNTKDELKDTKYDLAKTKNDLLKTKHDLEQSIIQGLKGVEGAYFNTFEVGGSIDFYYPVAFDIHHEDNGKGNPRTPLFYDIFRAYYEKLFNSTSVGNRLGFTLKLLCTSGGWSGGTGSAKVLLHDWYSNKGVAKIQLFRNQESRLFIWLRGGGTVYHIRSPIDLTGKITIYLGNNSVASPVYVEDNHSFPANFVSPIPLGKEDPDLVKKGLYAGWGF